MVPLGGNGLAPDRGYLRKKLRDPEQGAADQKTATPAPPITQDEFMNRVPLPPQQVLPVGRLASRSCHLRPGAGLRGGNGRLERSVSGASTGGAFDPSVFGAAFGHREGICRRRGRDGSRSRVRHLGRAVPKASAGVVSYYEDASQPERGQLVRPARSGQHCQIEVGRDRGSSSMGLGPDSSRRAQFLKGLVRARPRISKAPAPPSKTALRCRSVRGRSACSDRLVRPSQVRAGEIRAPTWRRRRAVHIQCGRR